MRPRRLPLVVREASGIVARIAWSRIGGPPTRGVMCLVLNEAGEVLLVKNSYRKLWSLPGGWVEPGESFIDAAAREVAEETGVTLSGRPEFLCERINGTHVDHLYRGVRATAQVAVATPWEISSVWWCSPASLPTLAQPAAGVLALGD